MRCWHDFYLEAAVQWEGAPFHSHALLKEESDLPLAFDVSELNHGPRQDHRVV